MLSWPRKPLVPLVYFACHAEVREGGCVSWANLVFQQVEGGALRRHRVAKAARRRGRLTTNGHESEKDNRGLPATAGRLRITRIRHSGFGILSSFGIRASSFPEPLHPCHPWFKEL